ncbi:MAG: hypothetical protein CVU59_04870 [Deltaproteobacteria bacterium HGW-Deltaproteobacteria-17]|nr:MAG: hypothetical protein CVU59_04870 [Deltaproteobacteria bacterium HGW-Deltaproteobacteria-17]
MKVNPLADIQVFPLPHRGRLVCQVNRAIPVAAVYAWVHAGSCHEQPPRELGIAHMVEHMLFKGTSNQGVGDLALAVEGAGGSLNAWTAHDETVLHAAGPARAWQTFLRAITEALFHPTFDAAELEREKEVVLEEIRHGENSPIHRASDRIFEVSYPSGGYGRPILGSHKSVAAFTREDLLAFHARWYTPGNITFFVVGDIDPETVHATLKALIPRRARSRDEAPPIAPRPARGRLEILRGASSEAYLFCSLPLPEYNFDTTPTYDLLSTLLGDGESSRLAVALKHRDNLVLEAYATAFTPRGPGLFMISSIFSPEHAERLFEALSNQLRGLTRVMPSELEKARATIAAEQVSSMQTVQGMARLLGFFQGATGDHAAGARYDAALAQRTVADLEAAAAVLNTRPMTAVLLLPEDFEVDEARLQKAYARLFKPEKGVVSPATTAGAEETPIFEYRIPRGPRLLVMPDARLPYVSARVGFIGGLLRETAEISGISPLTAGLLTRGADALPGDAISHLIESKGGVLQSFSGRNSLGIRLDTLSEGREMGLSLLCRSLRSPAFFEREVRKERELAREAVRAEADSHAVQVMHLFEMARYGENHCCSLNITGELKSLARLNRERIREHWEQNYPPAEATFVVVGDVDPQSVFDQVSAELAGLGKRAKAPSPDLTAPALPARSAAYVRKKITQNHIVTGFPGVDLHHPDRFALEVAARLLDGQSGRLFMDLRDRQGLAYQVSCFSLEGLAPGYFVAYMVTRPEQSQHALYGLLEHFARLRSDAPPEEEVERTKNFMLGTHDLGMQRRSAIAAAVFFGDLYGLGWNSFLRYRKALESVTPDDIKRVARKYFQPRTLVTAIYGPENITVDRPWT